MITYREFHRNPFSVLAKGKKYIWHGTGQKTQREAATDRLKHNASGVA